MNLCSLRLDKHFIQLIRFSPEAKAARNPFCYLPFGVGPHSCIGMHLAQQEIKIVMAAVLRRFRFVSCPQTQVCMFAFIMNLSACFSLAEGTFKVQTTVYAVYAVNVCSLGISLFVFSLKLN